MNQQATDSKTRTIEGHQAKRASIARAHTQSGTANAIHLNCVTIDSYIAAVERIEQKYAKKGKPISPFKLISALRKIWNGAEYDCDSSGVAQWGARLYHSHLRFWNTVKTKYYSVFDTILYGSRDNPRLGRKLVAYYPQDWNQLVGVRCLRTKQHGCVDFGHVLCGLDACVNCKKTHTMHDKPNELGTKQRLESAVTWAGDVGSVYGEAKEEWYSTRVRGESWQRVVTKKAVTGKDFDGKKGVWTDMAHDDDLFGDVDGIVLGTRLRKKAAANQLHSLAKELKDYYVDNSWSQDGIFKTFNSIYGNRAMDAAFVTPHVKAFVDALTVGTPEWDEPTMRRCVSKWQAFVARHVKGPARRHACNNSKDEDYRITYNKNRRGRLKNELEAQRPALT